MFDFEMGFIFYNRFEQLIKYREMIADIDAKTLKHQRKQNVDSKLWKCYDHVNQLQVTAVKSPRLSKREKISKVIIAIK